MNIIELYSNTLISKNGLFKASIFTVPSKCFNESKILQSESLFEALKIEKHRKIRPHKLWNDMPDVIFDSEWSKEVDSDSDIDSEEPFVPKWGYLFLEELIYGKHVIIENSPLSMESLANLVNSATGVGLGAFLGFIIGEGRPILFLTVPAGMVICGSAAAVSRALEKGLEKRLLKLLVGKDNSEKDSKSNGTRRIRI
ncbi:MAG: hypothetical protein LWX08_16185 [Deltaproteobacteria bacterium]|jgi:hypothetical protein|nr:hypothetical protein [Deltaproteobacteria bacterium]